MPTPYVPKNILINGAAGFIASHVCNRLIRNYPDYKIVVLYKLDYCSNLKNLLPSNASPDFKFFKETFFEFTKNNIYGTHVLLEACKTMGQIKRFIHVSTDEVYGGDRRGCCGWKSRGFSTPADKSRLCHESWCRNASNGIRKILWSACHRHQKKQYLRS